VFLLVLEVMVQRGRQLLQQTDLLDQLEVIQLLVRF
jgi:hypothetical protein